MLTLNIKISDEQVQNIPKGPLRSKQEVIHSSANATNKHIPNCEQGSKGPETSQLSSVLATIPQELGEVAEFVHQGPFYSV